MTDTSLQCERKPMTFAKKRSVALKWYVVLAKSLLYNDSPSKLIISIMRLLRKPRILFPYSLFILLISSYLAYLFLSLSLVADKSGNASVSSFATREVSSFSAEFRGATCKPGRIFLCGYKYRILAKFLFPEFAEQSISWYFDEQDGSQRNQIPASYKPPNKDDILVFGLHGPCPRKEEKGDPLEEYFFPGKTLLVNAESHGGLNSTPDGLLDIIGNKDSRKIFQIGNIGDSPQSVRVFFAAMFLMEKRQLWQALFDPRLKPRNTAKYHAIIYLAQNCVFHREKAVGKLAQVLPVHYGGSCSGNHYDNSQTIKAPKDPPKSWADNVSYVRDYKFCVVMENRKQTGYITEKIILAFLAGCIPIYYGTEEIFDIFHSEAFVYYDIKNPKPALTLIKELSTNESAYYRMLRHRPILAHGDSSVEEFFSLSDSIGNATLKWKIRKVMGLP